MLRLKLHFHLQLFVNNCEGYIEDICACWSDFLCEEDVVPVKLAVEESAVLQGEQLLGLADDSCFEELVLAPELVLDGAIVDELPIDDVEHDIEVRVIPGLNQLHQPHLQNAFVCAQCIILGRAAPFALVAFLEVKDIDEVVDAERVAELYAFNGLVVVAAVFFGPLEEDVECEIGKNNEEDFLIVAQVLPLLVIQHTL